MRVIDEGLLQRVGEYITQFQAREGRSPTQREVMVALRITAPRAHKYIHKLKDRGRLDIESDGRIEMPFHLDSSEVVNVGLLGTIPCGSPTEAVGDFEGMFRIPLTFTGAGEFFMLRAKGDSMTGAGIIEGDYLIIREQPTANSGEVVAAIKHSEISPDNGEATLKRLMRIGDKYVLHPENDVYVDIDAAEYKILGKLVGFYRKM